MLASQSAVLKSNLHKPTWLTPMSHRPFIIARTSPPTVLFHLLLFLCFCRCYLYCCWSAFSPFSFSLASSSASQFLLFPSLQPSLYNLSLNLSTSLACILPPSPAICFLHMVLIFCLPCLVSEAEHYNFIQSHGSGSCFLLNITYKHGITEGERSWYREQKKLLGYHIPHNSLLCFISALPAWAVKLPEQ